jgi:hypothetical protein
MRRQRRLVALLTFLLVTASGAHAAEASYPFVGSWIRSDRSCVASPTRERVYTAKDVISNRSRCSIRRIASGSGGYQLFERCERPNEKPQNVNEIIRMTGPDSMVLTRQTARLKLSRSLHFTRCNAPPSSPTKQPAH